MDGQSECGWLCTLRAMFASVAIDSESVVESGSDCTPAYVELSLLS